MVPVFKTSFSVVVSVVFYVGVSGSESTRCYQKLKPLACRGDLDFNFLGIRRGRRILIGILSRIKSARGQFVFAGLLFVGTL